LVLQSTAFPLHLFPGVSGHIAKLLRGVLGILSQEFSATTIGTAHDLWTAFREGAFGKQPRPFVGWLVMVEDAPQSRRAVTND
jgi:hypothetical protein